MALRVLPVLAAATTASAAFFGVAAPPKVVGGAYSFSARTLGDNKLQEFSEYKGQAQLHTNAHVHCTRRTHERIRTHAPHNVVMIAADFFPGACSEALMSPPGNRTIHSRTLVP